MTLQDLFNGLTYPNAFTTDQKISWINSIKLPKDVLSEICNRELLKFTTIADKPFYDELKDGGVDFKLIESVTVDGVEYVEKDKDDKDEGNYYAKYLNGTLFLNPTPDGVYSVYVYYFVDRKQYTSDDLNNELTISSDYVELLKIGVQIFMAKADADSDMIDNQVNDLMYLINQYQTDKNVSNNSSNQIEDVMGWF